MKLPVGKIAWICLFCLSGCSRRGDQAQPEPQASAAGKTPIDVEKTLASSRAGQKLLPKIKLKRAENALMDGKYEEALQLYEEMGKETQLTAEARSQLFAGQAEALFHLKRYDESVSMWERVLALRPDDPFAYQNLALALSESGRYKEAAARLQELLKIDPDILAARLDMVNLLKKMGASQEALVQAAQAFDTARQNVDRRLKEAAARQDSEEMVRLLGYLAEVPTETLEESMLEPLLAHAVPAVREKAGVLAARTEKGKKRVFELLSRETDPLVRDAWNRALAPEGAAP